MGSSFDRDAPEKADDVFDEAFLRRLEGLALVVRRSVVGRYRAERRSKKVGAGIEVADHREYVPGDDFRHLDARLFARTGRLFVRLFEEEEDASVHVVLDVSRSMATPAHGMGATRLTLGKRMSAALAFIALQGLDRVSVATVADGRAQLMRPVHGKGRIHAILEHLRAASHASLGGPGATDLESAARAIAASSRRRGLAIVVSDFYDPAGFEHALDRLRHARFEVGVVHLWDPGEIARLPAGDLVLVDAELGTRRDVSMTAELRALLVEAQRKHRQRLRAYCRAKALAHAEIPVDVPWDQAVLRVLAQGGLIV